MSAMTRRAHELDCVELLAAADGWPVGTTGAVVWEDAETALVEVSPEHYGTDAEGFPLRDLLEVLVDVPYGDLRITTPYVPRER